MLHRFRNHHVRFFDVCVIQKIMRGRRACGNGAVRGDVIDSGVCRGKRNIDIPVIVIGGGMETQCPVVLLAFKGAPIQMILKTVSAHHIEDVARIGGFI